jgi:hypothetical protein
MLINLMLLSNGLYLAAHRQQTPEPVAPLSLHVFHVTVFDSAQAEFQTCITSILKIILCAFCKYSHAPQKDVSVNDGPHIRRW